MPVEEEEEGEKKLGVKGEKMTMKLNWKKSLKDFFPLFSFGKWRVLCSSSLSSERNIMAP